MVVEFITTIGAPLQLASTLRIESPRALLLGYVHNRYLLYDGVPIPRDNLLGPTEIALSIMVNSQISGNTAEGIWNVRDKINSALDEVPDAALNAPSGDRGVPGHAGISRAISEMCRVPRVKLSTATKILHKKRPSLIPILDRVVEGHYWPELKDSSREDNWGDYAVKVMELFKRDLLSVQARTRELASEVQAAGTPLTECRILEVLMWATLSENEHIYLRSA